MSDPVQIPPFNPELFDTIGTLAIDRRSRNLRMTELGAGFAWFTEDTTLGPDPLPYEEMLYVLEGEMRVIFGDSDDEVIGHVGDMILLQTGQMTTFIAPKGTKVVYSLVPHDFRERSEAGEGAT